MSKLPAGARADARRNAEAILTAAARVLGERKGASVDEIAAAAGLTRQAVYGHFPSRAALVRAVVERLTAAADASLEAAALDEGTAVEALRRYVAAAWRLFEQHPFLLGLAAESLDATEAEALHAQAQRRLERLLRRGRRSGEFDRSLSVRWLLPAIAALGHAAGAEAADGRLSMREAEASFERSVLRLVGAALS